MWCCRCCTWCEDCQNSLALGGALILILDMLCALSVIVFPIVCFDHLLWDVLVLFAVNDNSQASQFVMLTVSQVCFNNTGWY